MSIFENLKNAFWSTSFWLPENKTWENFHPNDGQRYPEVTDIYIAWLFVPVILAIKYILERHIFVRIAAFGGINTKPRRKPAEVDILEDAFRSNSKTQWSDWQLTVLSKQLEWSTERIQKWFKERKNLDIPTAKEKFCDSSWRSTIFAFLLTLGVWAHWDKEWFWNLDACWENYPQPVPSDLRWYFILSTANYSSWMISHFTDVQRKDPGVMLFHHVITVSCLCGQWICNYYRYGLIICLLHDVCDFLLEISKVMKYLGWKIMCTVMFIAFFLAWVITRDIIFPFYVIPSGFYRTPQNVSDYFPFKHNGFNGAFDITQFKLTASLILWLILYSLMVLHIYWTFLIIRVIFIALTTGKMEDDVVSDDEDEEIDEIYRGNRLETAGL